MQFLVLTEIKDEFYIYIKNSLFLFFIECYTNNLNKMGLNYLIIFIKNERKIYIKILCR